MPQPKSSNKKAVPKPNNKKKGQVLFLVEGIPVRDRNILSVYIPQFGFVKLAEIVAKTGLSFAKVLGYSATPCECCKGKPVIIEVKGQKVEIPRGILNANREEIGNKKIRRK